MAQTTFSGPIRAGTARDTSGLVTSGYNVGRVVLAQEYAVGFASVATAPTAVNMFVLPAGSQILRFRTMITTAFSGNGVTAVGVQIGKSGSAAFYMASVAAGIASVVGVQATIDAAMVAAQVENIGTADITLQGTFTATTGNPTAGAMKLIVEYVQRNSDGT